MKDNIQKFLTGARIFLIFLLVLGVLSSSFGVVVAATSNQTVTPDNPTGTPGNPDGEDTVTETVYPTDQYGGTRDGEATLQDGVVALSAEDAALIHGALKEIESYGNSYYSQPYLRLIMDSYTLAQLDPEAELTEEQEAQVDAAAQRLEELLNRLDDYEMIYLPAGSNPLLAGDRFFRVRDTSDWGSTFNLEVYEPHFEEVFQSLDICDTEALSEENLQEASCIEGVSFHFGNIETEMPEAVPTAADGMGTAQIVPLANEISTKGNDLIIDLNCEIDSEEYDNGFEDSLTLTGSFGIRDLKAHLVCDMPTPGKFQELYFGLSGQTFKSIKLEGKLEGEAAPEATEKDLFLVELEGLNEKRFPIAIFQFAGTTPVKISNKAFQTSRESLIPSLYVVLYADWEGSISVSLSLESTYTESFNNGLRVFKNGDVCLQFEDYPYVSSYPEQEEEGLTWGATLAVEANTDLTLFGASVLFYVAGVNVGELGVARLGVEAECNISLTASSNEKDPKITGGSESSCYIRGYLKILEAKIKLLADGEYFLEDFELDIDFGFCLLDLTLFQIGDQPEKYRPSIPISSMERPESFDSIICLVCDVSGSMNDRIDNQTKLQAAKAAAKTIVATTENWNKSYEGNFGVGVVQFSDGSQTVALPHIDYTYLRACVDTMGDGGGTQIYTGIDTAVEQLKNEKADKKVIILMTDGQDSSDSTTRASAEAAKEEDITIYTIGFGNGVNETLLQDVADITGGEYQFANTDNIMSIMGSFIEANYKANDAKIMGEIEGALEEGKSSDEEVFLVKNDSGDLHATTVYPGSFLQTILTDPNGRVVDEEYPGAVVDETSIPSNITVKNPLPGQWSVRVKAIETSYEKEPFYTIVAFKETEGSDALNREMNRLETVAAYALPVGLVVTVSSLALLCAIGWRRKVEVKETEELTASK